MSGVKIGIGFGQWKYGLPEPELICRSAEQAEAVGLDSMYPFTELALGELSLSGFAKVPGWTGERTS